jgi:hypothetical protein
MKDHLSESDEQFIHDLLQWNSRRRTVDLILCNFALIVAGAIIIIAALSTLARLTDQRIVGILVPGFIIGLLFVDLYIILCKRIKERHRIALIMEKLIRAS